MVQVTNQRLYTILFIETIDPTLDFVTESISILWIQESIVGKEKW